MIKRVALALAAALALLLAVPATAEANVSGSRWTVPHVCLEDHAASRWPVSTVGWKYNRHPELYVRTRTSCAGWKNVIRIYSGNYGYTGWCGQASVSKYNGTNTIRTVTIRLNNKASCIGTANDRASTTSHEIGHAFGLAHDYRTDSVMSTRRGYELPYPTAYNFSDLHRIY